MNKFDVTILHFLNQFSQRSWTFDHFLALVQGNYLLRGGVIIVLFFWAWAKSCNERGEERRYLLFGLLSSVFAAFLARGLASILPYRTRPIRNPLLDFRIPFGMNPDSLIGWSSFPSDHAALFVCLSVAIWFASKRVGAVALGYTCFLILLPRIYLGIHYPTDILAGMLLGIGVASLAKITWLRRTVTMPGMHWLEAHPASFYGFLFLCCFEIAESFSSLRDIAGFGSEALHRTLISLR